MNLRNIDDFIIDRIFQPISDRLANWASCYGIAAFLLTGFGLIFASCKCMEQDYIGLGLMVLWVPGMILRAHHLDAKPESSVLPVDRVTGIWVRLILVSLLPLDVMSVFIFDDPLQRIKCASWLLSDAGIYFMACRKRPPMQRRSKVPVGAVAEAGL